MQQQVDPMTGVPIANPQQQPQQVPANMQGGLPQNFISQSQQKVVVFCIFFQEIH